MNIELTIAIALVGLTIVIIALIVFAAILAHQGKILGGIVNPHKKELSPSASIKSAAPAVDQGIGDDVVAAIAAAVAYMMGEGTGGYTIRSVKRASAPRKAWQMAGIMQNTRSF